MGGMSDVVHDMHEEQRESDLQSALQSAMNGGDPLQVLYLLITHPSLARGQNAYFDTFLQQVLSRYNTKQAQDYETNLANTDILRAADQLGALGLSPSNVYQTGASAVPNVSAASTPSINNANQRLNRQTSIANALIGMAGRMASSGIYGGSLAAVRGAAKGAAAAVAHSAPAALNTFEPKESLDDLIKFFEG